MIQKEAKTRVLALTLAALTAAGAAVPAAAADSGIAPACDEAYYATLDYYGNLMEGSVVKSYALNGASALTDYGVYDEVHNLTDATPVSLEEERAVFQFDQAPGHFYFEGKTAQPFQNLPWSIALHYTLNGVPVPAEELAGKTGVVEILLDLAPNPETNDYARYNYTLEAMAVFNQDDILSLEAPGAQVQLVGNLRTVLFVALPGEERHFTIRVGSDDFSFGGMTFLMVPATLAQLEDVARLSQRKEDLEEDYQALSGSLDTLLDALNDVQSGLYASANGLDQLNAARGTVSAGKDAIYEDAEVLRQDLSGLAGQLEPVEERVRILRQTVTDSQAALGEMADTAVSLKQQLNGMEDALKELESGNKDIKSFLSQAADLEDSLHRLEKALDRVKMPSAPGSSGGLLDKVLTAHSAYAEKDETEFFKKMLTLQGDKDASGKAEQMTLLLSGYQAAVADKFAEAQAAGLPVTEEQVAEQVKAAMLADPDHPEYQALPKILELDLLFQAKGGMDFKAFCKQLPGVSASQAEQMNELWLVYCQVSGIQDDLGETLTSVSQSSAGVVGELADLCGELDDLRRVVDAAGDLSAVLREAVPKLNRILDGADRLRGTLDGYEPTLQEGLNNLGEMSAASSSALRDMETLMASTEALMKTSGQQLDAGTQQTLQGLADTLRKTAKAMAATSGVQDAKSTVNGIVEDTWEEYTGGASNLLMMDAGARPVSLTDERNPAPASVQILIRTQEIKAEEAGAEAAPSAAAPAATSFWERVVQMFRDFWNALTGIFR